MFGWKKQPANPESCQLDDWMVAQGEVEGRPLVLRFCEGVGPVRGHAAYRHCVRIEIPLHDPDPDGFPGEAELQQLNEIEDQLDAALTQGYEALTLIVLTHDGVREHAYQTRDLDATIAKITALAQRIQTHRLGVAAAEDAGWEYYQEFMR